MQQQAAQAAVRAQDVSQHATVILEHVPFLRAIIPKGFDTLLLLLLLLLAAAATIKCKQLVLLVLLLSSTSSCAASAAAAGSCFLRAVDQQLCCCCVAAAAAAAAAASGSSRLQLFHTSFSFVRCSIPGSAQHVDHSSGQERTRPRISSIKQNACQIGTSAANHNTDSACQAIDDAGVLRLEVLHTGSKAYT
eukprot:16248-Heterococcus_DN1.PRE.2